MKLQIALLAAVLLLSCGQPETKIVVKNKELLEFQLGQRSSKDIPAINGKVKVQIGDITGGQTWLTIMKDSVAVFEKSIHQGDTLDFQIDRSEYKITCLEMINNLIGYDMATFSVFEQEKQ